MAHGEGAHAPRPARRPLPWSADDVNPSELYPTVNEWLQGSIMPPKGCGAHASSKGGSGDPSAPPFIDVRKMTHATLLVMANKHNAQFNVVDPVGQALHGIRERAALKDPSRASHPFTLGGNPTSNEYTKAWGVIASGNGRVGKRGGNGGAAEAPQDVKQIGAAPKQRGPRPKVAYGELTPEQTKFNASLGAFLGGIEVKLPLVAPGAVPLDMKRLFTEVFSSGGYHEVCAREDGWESVSSALVQDSSHGGIIKQIYYYYLFPVDMAMPVQTDMRVGRLTEALMKLMEPKASGRGTAMPQRPPELPSAKGVRRANKAARTELRSFDGGGGSGGNGGGALAGGELVRAAAPRLALQLLRAMARGVDAAAAGNLRLETGPALAAAAVAATAAAAAAAAAVGAAGAGASTSGASGAGASGASASGAASSSGLPRTLSGWEQARALEALLLSHRATEAGPAVLRKPAPALKKYYLQQLGLDGLDSSDDDGDERTRIKRRVSDGAATAEREFFLSQPGQKRSKYAPGFTPRCGGCDNCLNPARKQACTTNRAIAEKFMKKSEKERVDMGDEPKFVFTTEAARVRGMELMARWKSK
ncbi:hypothetical protein FOA52_012917 [Chlamydomonas sp. UWO 241]|nr:hypothetical protein FOA52_012917 [Chlamydomonas sp. UWO 241]